MADPRRDATAMVHVNLLPSGVIGRHHPGHMGLSWETDGLAVFRGFGFKVDDLPKGFRNAHLWRSYLFEHTVPGYVFNDLIIQDALAQRGADVLVKSWPVGRAHIERLEMATKIGPGGWYSFAPDRHPECHN